MARGSRYKIERAVGPITIDNNTYFDVAKANLHIGEVYPVPDFAIHSVASGTHDVAYGALLRIVSTSDAADQSTIAFSYNATIRNNTSGVEEVRELTPTIANNLAVRAATPTGFTLVRDEFRQSVFINGGALEYFIVATGNIIRVSGSTLVRLEMTRDD